MSDKVNFNNFLFCQIVEKNPYALVLPTPVLFEQAEVQLQQELSGVVTVKSIVKKSEPSHRTLEYVSKI